MYNMYETIAKLCDEKGISVAAMCKSIGLRQGLMSDLKHGRSKALSSKTVSQIADFFNVTSDYILGKESVANQINKTIVERVILYATIKNMELSAVEAKVGLKSGEIENWQFQQKTPDFNVLVDVAEELETSVPYLMGTTNDPAPLPKEKAPTQTGERSDDELTMQILEALKNADREQREAILTLLTRK